MLERDNIHITLQPIRQGLKFDAQYDVLERDSMQLSDLLYNIDKDKFNIQYNV